MYKYKDGLALHGWDIAVLGASACHLYNATRVVSARTADPMLLHLTTYSSTTRVCGKPET